MVSEACEDDLRHKIEASAITLRNSDLMITD